MTHPHNGPQDNINEEAINETERFLQEAMSIINATYSNCGLEGFQPQPLTIPQGITDQPGFDPSEIASDDFYQQAEAMWNGQAQFFNGEAMAPPTDDNASELGAAPALSEEEIQTQMLQNALNMGAPQAMDESGIATPSNDDISPDIANLLNGG